MAEWILGTARGAHRLLRHRHARDAGQLCRPTMRVPLAAQVPRLRSVSLVHGRADAAPAGDGCSVPSGRARSTARSIRTLYFPEEVAARWELGYMGTYSADRQRPLDALLLAAAASIPLRGSWSPARCTRPSSSGPPNVERIEHLCAGGAPRVLRFAALDPEPHARRHEGGGVSRRACACSRRRPAGCPALRRLDGIRGVLPPGRRS